MGFLTPVRWPGYHGAAYAPGAPQGRGQLKCSGSSPWEVTPGLGEHVAKVDATERRDRDIRVQRAADDEGLPSAPSASAPTESRGSRFRLRRAPLRSRGPPGV